MNKRKILERAARLDRLAALKEEIAELRANLYPHGDPDHRNWYRVRINMYGRETYGKWHRDIKKLQQDRDILVANGLDARIESK